MVTRGASLVWRNWDDDEHVVFCDASGDTHLVNDVTAEVLRQLERSERDFSDLVLRVAESFGAEPDERFETSVARLLVYLDQVGLVEPAA
jgi:PqqD family protein of HPr-rel-A system